MRLLMPVLLLSFLPLPAPALSLPTQLAVARLIKQLGSPSFPEREAASRRLEALGERALTDLRAAEKFTKDAEVRARARRTVAAIEFRLRWEDNHRLYGTWRVTVWEEDGKPLPPESYFGSVRFTGQWHLVHMLQQDGPRSDLILGHLSDLVRHPDRIDWQVWRGVTPGEKHHFDMRGERWFTAGRSGDLRTLEIGFPRREFAFPVRCQPR